MADAAAIPSKRVRQQRALLVAFGSVIVIGLAATGFHYLDAQTEQLETVGGTVTNMWRERGGYVYCQVLLSDGLTVNEMCDGFPVGTQVLVERYRRRITGRIVYGSPRAGK